MDEKIEKLINLRKLLLVNNILEKLPETVYSLPRLIVLNIDRNNFKKKEITEIRNRLKNRINSGEKIYFSTIKQGYEQEVKKLLAMNKTENTDEEAYYNQCLATVREEPYSVGCIDTEKISAANYALLCEEAIKRSCHVIGLINPEKLDRYDYFSICMLEARSAIGLHYPTIGFGPYFKCIRDDLLTDNQYIRVCLETALNNNIGLFHKYLNLKRLGRDEYEHIWWVAILHNPDYFFEMNDPTPELCLHAAKNGAFLGHIPEPMRTYEICLLAARQGKAGYYKDDALENVPLKFRDEQILAMLPKQEMPDEPY